MPDKRQDDFCPWCNAPFAGADGICTAYECGSVFDGTGYRHGGGKNLPDVLGKKCTAPSERMDRPPPWSPVRNKWYKPEEHLPLERGRYLTISRFKGKPPIMRIQHWNGKAFTCRAYGKAGVSKRVVRWSLLPEIPWDIRFEYFSMGSNLVTKQISSPK